MVLRIFTWAHVTTSFVAIAAGIVVLVGLVAGYPLDEWTLVFLIATGLASLTGFAFPFEKFFPPHALGIIALLVLVPTIVGRYTFHLDGTWRWIYMVGAVVSLYLNVFVLICSRCRSCPH